MLVTKVPSEFLIDELSSYDLDVLYQYNTEVYTYYNKDKIENKDKEKSHIIENQFVAYCKETKEFFHIKTSVSDEDKDINFERINFEKVNLIIDRCGDHLAKEASDNEKTVNHAILDNYFIKILRLNNYSNDFVMYADYRCFRNVELLTRLNLDLIYKNNKIY